MPRYRLTLEYDGTQFCGWQAQAEKCAVQDAVQAAIEKFCQEQVRLVGAGRTDTGVHALGQVAHGDFSKAHTARELRDGINFHLGESRVRVLEAQEVPDDFSARFSAITRHYRYVLCVRSASAVLDAKRLWVLPKPLDIAAMQAGAKLLCGKHDFTTFRAVGCQSASPVKTLDKMAVREEDGKIMIEAQARSFLHHQMRSMVGALKYLGERKWDTAQLKKALQAKDRTLCPPLAPPYGLYFVRVDYPPSPK